MTLTVRTATRDDGPALGRMGASLARLHHAIDAARLMLPDGIDEHGELIDVWVDPAARQAGAGALLVEEVLRRLTVMGAPRILLSTASSNAAAQRLFARLGFRSTMIEMTREG